MKQIHVIHLLVAQILFVLRETVSGRVPVHQGTLEIRTSDVDLNVLQTTTVLQIKHV